MEEQILKILIKGIDYKFPTFNIAKEIDILTHKHYLEFIKWLFSKKSKYAICYGSKTPLCTTYEDFTVEEVYKFWLNNIKDK